MTETLPDYISVPLIAILGVSALYRCYILPGYRKDAKRRSNALK